MGDNCRLAYAGLGTVQVVVDWWDYGESSNLTVIKKLDPAPPKLTLECCSTNAAIAVGFDLVGRANCTHAPVSSTRLCSDRRDHR